MFTQRHAQTVFAVVKICDALLRSQIAEAPVTAVHEVGHRGFCAVQIIVSDAIDIGREQEIVKNNDGNRITREVGQLQAKPVPGKRNIGAKN